MTLGRRLTTDNRGNRLSFDSHFSESAKSADKKEEAGALRLKRPPEFTPAHPGYDSQPDSDRFMVSLIVQVTVAVNDPVPDSEIERVGTVSRSWIWRRTRDRGMPGRGRYNSGNDACPLTRR